MNLSHMRRRGVLGWLGLIVPGVLVAKKSLALAGAAPARGAAPAVGAGVEAGSEARRAAPAGLAGLVAGDYRVATVSAVRDGSFALGLERADGDAFTVDVCAADDAADAPRGPARTRYLDLFVANDGAGSAPTREAHGLAVMALARALRDHEHTLPVSHLLPLRERLRRHGDRLFTTSSPAAPAAPAPAR